MTDRNHQPKRKRRYEKPRLDRVKISLEESLLSPCKSSNSEFGSPVPDPCSVCKIAGS